MEPEVCSPLVKCLAGDVGRAESHRVRAWGTVRPESADLHGEVAWPRPMQGARHRKWARGITGTGQIPDRYWTDWSGGFHSPASEGAAVLLCSLARGGLSDSRWWWLGEVGPSGD